MTVLDLQVNAGGDDVHVNKSASSFSSSASDLITGVVFGEEYAYSARFSGVSGLSGATIDVAEYEIRAGSSMSGRATTLTAEDAQSPSAPTSVASFTSRTQTSASVGWSAVWSTDTWYTSPSITSIIQELADTYDPSLVQIFHSADGLTEGIVRVRSYNLDTTLAPKLHIEYTANTAPNITVAPTVTYGSLTRTGPNNTPAVVSFTATDAEETGANALSYTIRTAASGGGTMVGSGTCTSGTSKNHNIANGDSGLVDGSQTLYLRIYDGTLYSSDSSFTLLRDTTAPTAGTITHSPNPVT